MIHLNAAGTSWPKPPGVADAIGRASDAPPEEWPDLLETARREIAAFFAVPDPERMLLTPGCTSALSVAIADVPWQPGDAAVTSSLEHRALLRPLAKLERRLRNEHGITTRAGHHCAPQAHQNLGTAVSGALRISLGPQNREGDVDAVVGGLREAIG